MSVTVEASVGVEGVAEGVAALELGDGVLAAAEWSLEGLQGALVGLLPHTSKDDLTPVLGCVAWDASAGVLLATDRYTVGRFALPAEAVGDLSESGAVRLVSREAAAWVAAVKASGLRRAGRGGVGVEAYRVRVEWLGEISASAWATESVDEIRVSVVHVYEGVGTVERSQVFDYVGGSFPPVARLLEGFKAAVDAYPVGLELEHLGKLSAFAKLLKGAPVRFTLSERGAAKLGPVRFEFVGYGFDGLIQQNLILS